MTSDGPAIGRRARERYGSIVMSTGVVAIALRLDGREVLSDVLLALAAALWLALAAWVAVGLATDRARIRREARELRTLTAVAATCVLGAGLAALGWTGAAQALLAIGVALWCCLLPVATAALPATPSGFVFLLAVSTQAVAVLAATLAPRLNAPWEAVAALALLALGLVLYLVGLRRFPLAELRRGGGEIWIAGGALAIAALACGELIRAVDDLGSMGSARDALAGLGLALWIGALAWVPLLLWAEARRPRLGYAPARWATVFPLGMYAASSFVIGDALSSEAVKDVARVWVWIAFACWCLAAIGLIRGRLTGRGVPARA